MLSGISQTEIDKYSWYHLCVKKKKRRLTKEWASLVAQLTKNPPAMQETWVWFLGWEDPWRRAWLPIPVFWPGEFHGQRSLAGYSPWGGRELDTLSDFHFHRIEWWLLAAGERGKWGQAGKRVQTFSCKIVKFWGSNVQHGDYSRSQFLYLVS